MKHESDLIDLTKGEIHQQDEKWGEDRQEVLPGDWSLIIQEELGEAAKDCLEGNPLEAVEELVQVAAVALQWANSIMIQGRATGVNK